MPEPHIDELIADLEPLFSRLDRSLVIRLVAAGIALAADLVEHNETLADDILDREALAEKLATVSARLKARA